LVRVGESLYDICQAEGVRFEDMLEMNQLTPGVQPAAGERIYLQGSAPSRPRLVNGGSEQGRPVQSVQSAGTADNQQ
jgi:hypothetical protein